MRALLFFRRGRGTSRTGRGSAIALIHHDWIVPEEPLREQVLLLRVHVDEDVRYQRPGPPRHVARVEAAIGVQRVQQDPLVRVLRTEQLEPDGPPRIDALEDGPEELLLRRQMEIQVVRKRDDRPRQLGRAPRELALATSEYVRRRLADLDDPFAKLLVLQE